MLFFRADVPEEVAQRKGRRRAVKKAGRAVGATLVSEMRLRLLINKILNEAAKLTREKGLPEAQTAKEQLAVDHRIIHDTTFGLVVFAQQLRSFFDTSVRNLPRWLRPIFESEEQRQRTAFVATVRATFSVDVTPVVRAADVASHIDAAMMNSINQITGMTDELAKRVQNVLMNGALQGKRSTDVASALSDQFNWSLKRSKLIARDQMATFNGALNKVRQKQVGFDKYIWSTSLDERVRPEHAAREGKVFSWDDPPEDGHPGEPINCRCVARPYVDVG